jgi:hypothetical protein
MFMTLSVASGTFSVNPSLSACRIVPKNSPAFELIDRMFNYPYHVSPVDCSAGLIKLFQTRKASPHDRLMDGTTLLHVSFDLVDFSICKYTEHRERFCEQLTVHSGSDFLQYGTHDYRSVADHLLRYMSYADASDTNDDDK